AAPSLLAIFVSLYRLECRAFWPPWEMGEVHSFKMHKSTARLLSSILLRLRPVLRRALCHNVNGAHDVNIAHALPPPVRISASSIASARSIPYLTLRGSDGEI